MSVRKNMENTAIWQVYEQETPNSITRFDQEQNVRLEEELRLDHLCWLKEAFANHMPLEGGEEGQDVGLARFHRKEPKRQPGSMTLREFQEALTDMLGSEKWTSQMELLFNKVDTSCDGYVDWDEFCTYMLLQYKERDFVSTRRETFLGTQPLIRLCLHNKQEVTTRILAVPSPPPLRFVSVSKASTLTVWDSDLRIQKSYEIASESNDFRSGRRRFKTWTTDAVYMPNVNKVAVATTSRDIHFFDVSTTNCFEEFHLFAINNVPNSLCYWCNTKSPASPSLLLWGDDVGGVNLMWFLKPHTGMFETPFTEEQGPQKVFIQDIKDHNRLITYQIIPHVHQEPISKIMYLPMGDLIITSSGSTSTSVVIMDLNRKNKVYTWKIHKGVTCFDFSKPLNLLVTGGMDHKVRLWNQYVTSQPIVVLHEHSMIVQDVAIYEPLGQIFSYSKDAVLKVWDISSQQCLRTLVLKFPCVQAGRVLEYGDFPFLLLKEPPCALLVSCGDYIGMLKLEQGGNGQDMLFTHSAKLSTAIYNPFFRQVVTGCDDSTVAVWDVETGTKCLQLNNVHGQEEITCMSFDTTQRRLITGARNGTIKVWNVQNGHNLHKLEPVAEAEVTRVLCYQDHKFLAVGWSHQLALYNTTDRRNTYVVADLSWRGGQLHKEDILAADSCPVLELLATASYDGEIIVWNTETQQVLTYLKRSRDRQVQPPVDKLLFLQRRAADTMWNNKPILISSEAGALYWWRVSGSPYEQDPLLPSESKKADNFTIPSVSSLESSHSVTQETPDSNDKLLKSHLGVQVEQGLARKMAARQERRCVFGEIDDNKLIRFGNMCTPFQALATPDMLEVQLLSALPMSSWMLSRGLACVRESDLETLPLSRQDLECEYGEESARAKGKSRLFWK
ncbi:WD repeat-containing protein 49 [Acipenser ruthenus]|uniref:WD repeat-containing protein 49 n=1 Tax=Acipenser ruthenus TaxID=7906 RepID=A0A444UFG0_ACIRT|nr:WD repeat-containing protein 49 [Acipenser ruthenus]